MDVLGKYRKTERIGRLSERAQLHYATETVNAYGERVQAWASIGTVWANVEYNLLRSKEGEEAGQETAMQSVMFTIRKRALIDENWRIYHNARLYDIEAIGESNDRQLMTLKCHMIFPGVLTTPEDGYPIESSILAFTESFTGLTSDRVTVTVYGGRIPTDKARVLVHLNGQFITQYTIASDKIIFTGFTIEPTDTVTVTFFI
jgi:SPP1 family predicted phage head-tail adaptor